MKVLLRAILLNLLVLYLTDVVYPGFSLNHTAKALLSAAIIWWILNKIVKPIIKILLLPINLITLNLFSWVINVLTLILLQMIVDGVKISTYAFPGFNFEGFVIPPINVNLFFSYLITSITLNTFMSFIKWLIRKDDN